MYLLPDSQIYYPQVQLASTCGASSKIYLVIFFYPQVWLASTWGHPAKFYLVNFFFLKCGHPTKFYFVNFFPLSVVYQHLSGETLICQFFYRQVWLVGGIQQNYTLQYNLFFFSFYFPQPLKWLKAVGVMIITNVQPPLYHITGHLSITLLIFNLCDTCILFNLRVCPASATHNLQSATSL